LLKEGKQMAEEQQFTIEWVDSGREPQCPPDPAFPNGKAVDLSIGGRDCYFELPYPTKRCGVYRIECNLCGYKIAMTTAGRADDPRSLRFPCPRPLNG
jgi:hypothetical protein